MKTKRKPFLSVAVLAIIMCMGFGMSQNAYAAISEKEPNNTFAKAQKIALGKQYSGTVKDENGDDEDCYRFQVKEGRFYKITVTGIKDLSDYKWETMIVSLCKDSNTNDSNTVLNGKYQNTAKLFRASYTGTYYLRFWNTSNTKYNFSVSYYNPAGKKVKDSNSNTYKITNNYKAELSNVASKRKTDFYFATKLYVSSIAGMDVLDYYDEPFAVNAIGNYAFQGCGITNISIPEEIKTIGVGAFQNCKKLGSKKYYTGVVINGKKVVIKAKAFNGCKKLGSIRIPKKASIKSVAKNSFKGTKKKIRVEVPSVKKYKKIFKKAGFKKPKYSKSYY